MKGYVVTLLNLPESIKMAERCISSARKFGVDVEIFPAVYKDVSHDEMEKEMLHVQDFDTSFSNVDAVVGNFISQYRIWKIISKSNEHGIVLEHDAVFIDKLPDLNDDIVNIGKPSYGNYNNKNSTGVYPMFSKQGGYIPGAHGYYITPQGADELIAVAKNKGIAPCDVFINTKNFPLIKETWPWIVEADDKFTTIQKEKGCKAKHNYNQGFKILT